MSFPSELVAAAYSIYAAGKAFDAYEYYAGKVTEGADDSLKRAKELWRLDRRIKEKVPEGYEWLASIPDYETCEDALKRSLVPNRSASIQAARNAARSAAGRGQIGVRRRIAREVSLNLTSQTMISADLAYQVEEQLEKIYSDMKDEAVMRGLKASQPYEGAAAASRRTGQIFGDLAARQSRAYNGSLTAAGVAIGRLFAPDNPTASAPEPAPLANPNWYV